MRSCFFDEGTTSGGRECASACYFAILLLLLCSAVAVVDTDAGGRAEPVLVHVLEHTIEYTELDPGQFIAPWAAALLLHAT
jgi:hypothetical protein